MEKILNRVQWVDFAKGVAIILMVVAHVIWQGTNLIAFIYTFHMPFFFVMAGYLLNTEKWSRRWEGFISKLGRRLLIPYFLANILHYPIWFIFCHCFGRLAIYDWATRDPVEVILAFFVGNTYNIGIWLILTPLWFLPCLFFAEIIFLKLNELFGKNPAKMIKIIILVSLAGCLMKSLPIILGLDIALAAQIFIFFGNWIRKNNFLDRLNFGTCIIFFAIMFAVTYFNGRIAMHNRTYGNPILFYIGGIVGSLFVMKISMWLANLKNKACEFVKFCGAQSMSILVFHYALNAVTYNFTVAIAPRNAELGLRLLEPQFEFFIIACGILIPVWIAKNFSKAPVIKYFCA